MLKAVFFSAHRALVSNRIINCCKFKKLFFFCGANVYLAGRRKCLRRKSRGASVSGAKVMAQVSAAQMFIWLGGASVALPYQLMFFLGLVNVTELCTAAICAGAFAIFGTVFCSQPTFMFWHGVLGTGLFFIELMTSCSLALNRLLNFYNVLLAERFFGGLKTLFWILLFLALTFWVSFWDPPHIYNPIINSFIQIPHYGYIELDTENEAFLFPLWSRYFSVAILCLTTLIYSAFLTIYISKRKQVITIGMEKKDKSVFVQVLWLSLLSFSVNLAYTFDQEASNLPFGQIIVPFYSYGFILYQGSPPVIYLLLNKTIRRELNLDNTPTVHPIGITNVKPFPISVNVSKNGMMIPVK